MNCQREMRYLSVCSGIEAATIAWHPLGWKAAAFSEIEKFPCAVLKHHYPDVPCHGDFTTIGKDDYGTVDVLVGGTPCQDFSVAGLRAGFAGKRGSLTIEFIHLAARKAPHWLVWENVPGILSVDDGRAFGTFLSGLAKCGYGFAYRILDAQYFGVPQRRRRVFVVGYFGDWRPAAAVLFERESLCGDITPRRETGEGIARTLKACAGSYTADGLGNEIVPETSMCLNAGGMGRQDAETETLITTSAIPIHAQAIRDSKGGENRNDDGRGNGLGIGEAGDPANTVTCAEQHAVAVNYAVRRLTPLECERLQGFPDNYTLIPGASDSARYKALGNSMAVPVMRWLGERINLIEGLMKG